MIFKQLFDNISSTYTYLLACEATGQAILIDPVLPEWERDLAEINKRGLKLAYTVETHIHADHISSALKLSQMTGSKIAGPALDALPCTQVGLEDGVPLQFGSLELQAIHTPGHTNNHFAYTCQDRLFSGDALMIEACGRTDFQSGDPAALYHSVREDFVDMMNKLNLAYPKFIDYAVPGNLACGVCPNDIPDNLQQYCIQMAETIQG